MMGSNDYDVTRWHTGNPYDDIGVVINSMIADVKGRQTCANQNDCGKPGATIYIPAGDYRLCTQVVIDISYLKITGSGHGFVSSSIRYNLPKDEWDNLHEVWPGGSRILVDLPEKKNASEAEQAAFLVNREGSPRISSVEFENFCIDGLHFLQDGSTIENPENTYTNGKTGIYVGCAQDSFRITGMGLIYLEHGITVYHADALSIHDNFIAECGNCIELREWGQASKITDNLIGAGFKGYSIFAQNFGGLLITANNIFPRGASSIYFDHVSRSNISANRLHSFYSGMLVFSNNCTENLIASNHLLRDAEPWAPMQSVDNGLNDDYGLLSIHGYDNTITANHISETISSASIKPTGIKPIMIRIVSGQRNFVMGNHIVAIMNNAPDASDSCFSSQVAALTRTDGRSLLPIIAVFVDDESSCNTVLDSGNDQQVVMDKKTNVFRPTPMPEGM